MFYNTRTIRSTEERHRYFQNYEYNPEWTRSHSTPEVNVLELDDRFLLEVALPGVVLDDIELKAEEQFLTVQAKRLPAAFEEDALVHLQEMPYSHLVRNFEFSSPVLAQQVEARMDRGILYISVPKKEIAHRIPVSAGMIEGRLPGLKTQVISKADATRQHSKETIAK